MLASKARILAFFVIVAAGFAADVATKHIAFNQLGNPETNSGQYAWVIPNLFGFQTSLNEGALFGFGQGWRWLFITLSFGAILGLTCWFLFGAPGRDKWLLVTLAMIAAGILGNLYDRLGLPRLEGEWVWRGGIRNGILHEAGEPIHAVRDFIVWKFGDYQWPNFNIADSLLVCGVIMLVFHAYVIEPKLKKKAAAAKPA